MNPACIVKFRPLGPWRIGPDSGARDRVDTLYHSDTLFSAVTAGMASLGRLQEWLDALPHYFGDHSLSLGSWMDLVRLVQIAPATYAFQ